MKGFHITHGRGFQMTFANGWTVSVQFGGGQYGDYYNVWPIPDDKECGEKGSNTAEVAVFTARETYVWLWDEQVRGYQTPDDVAQIIAEVAIRPPYIEEDKK